MTQGSGPTRPERGPEHYEIRVEGRLHSRWAEWIEDMAFQHHEDGTTTLTGPLADQPALHGVLTRMRDLGVSIISVHRLD